MNEIREQEFRLCVDLLGAVTGRFWEGSVGGGVNFQVFKLGVETAGRKFSTIITGQGICAGLACRKSPTIRQHKPDVKTIL